MSTWFDHLKHVEARVLETACTSEAPFPLQFEAGPLASGLFESFAQQDAAGDFILLVDSALTPVNPRWLDYLLMYAELEDVLSVAPSLFDASGACIISGATLDRREGLRPLMVGWELGEDGYAGSLSCDREVTASHGSLVLFRREALNRIGGVDPAFNTPFFAAGDIMVRGVKAGFRNISVARSLFCPSEDFSLSGAAAPIDKILFHDKHQACIRNGDPYYSVNFDAKDDYGQ